MTRAAEATRKWREANPEKFAADKARSYARHKERLASDPEYAARCRARDTARGRAYRIANKEKFTAYRAKYAVAHRGSKNKWLQKACARAKLRAAAAGYVHDIHWRDIESPDVCPIMLTPLKYEMGTRCDASPSLDKIIPAKGYVKGNVWVISNLANRLKSDATPEQLMRVALAVAERVGHG